MCVCVRQWNPTFSQKVLDTIWCGTLGSPNGRQFSSMFQACSQRPAEKPHQDLTRYRTQIPIDIFYICTCIYIHVCFIETPTDTLAKHKSWQFWFVSHCQKMNICSLSLFFFFKYILNTDLNPQPSVCM